RGHVQPSRHLRQLSWPALGAVLARPAAHAGRGQLGPAVSTCHVLWGPLDPGSALIATTTEEQDAMLWTHWASRLSRTDPDRQGKCGVLGPQRHGPRVVAPVARAGQVALPADDPDVADRVSSARALRHDVVEFLAVRQVRRVGHHRVAQQATLRL